jgi:hypothetical protein
MVPPLTRLLPAHAQSPPAARGPLSAALLEVLNGAAPADQLSSMTGEADPYGDDLQLALHLAYELHYRPMRGVDAHLDWTREPPGAPSTTSTSKPMPCTSSCCARGWTTCSSAARSWPATSSSGCAPRCCSRTAPLDQHRPLGQRGDPSRLAHAAILPQSALVRGQEQPGATLGA